MPRRAQAWALSAVCRSSCAMSESLISIDARRNGRAFASLTARGGGLPVGVTGGLTSNTTGGLIAGAAAFCCASPAFPLAESFPETDASAIRSTASAVVHTTTYRHRVTFAVLHPDAHGRTHGCLLCLCEPLGKWSIPSLSSGLAADHSGRNARYRSPGQRV